MKTPTTYHSSRSRQLRRHAELVHPVVAQAFRRRASEVELTMWVRHVIDRPVLAHTG